MPESLPSRHQPTDTLSYHPPSTVERVSALRLLADSIVHQRQFQNKALITHPYFIAAIGALIALVLASTWDTSPFGTQLLLSCGCIMAAMVTVGRVTSPLLKEAENLGSRTGLRELEKKESVVCSWKNEVIGVIAWEETAKKGSVVVNVWGWTVRKRERGRGVGGDLIREMVIDIKRRRKGQRLEVQFDDKNIHPKRTLAAKYNWMLDDAQKRAETTLEKYVKLYIDED